MQTNTVIEFEQEEYKPQQGESILDCLLRHGVSPPHSCRSGVCQTCLMRSVDGKPPETAQKGLKQSLVVQDYFLACSCVPQDNMQIVLPDTGLFRKTTTVVDKTWLNDSVIRLRLAVPEGFSYFAGQYLTIFRDQHTGRSYSLASVPDIDDFLEFHIQIIPGGELSQWIVNDLDTGSEVTISEAIGDCMYLEKLKQQPMVLIGTGTGLAPLLGVLRDALHQGHQQNIRLYYGVKTRADLYLHDQLQEIAAQHGNVEYYPCISREEVASPFRHGRASDLAIEDIGNFSNYSIYLCGNPEMVNTAKRNIFLAGASFQNIFADPFVHA
ncbi:MAG: FAD-binding oxidoreductase [Gammaproteobacteria bacterium]|jgi:NAD(P)H-flavin reductase/ferredoxin